MNDRTLTDTQIRPRSRQVGRLGRPAISPSASSAAHEPHAPGVAASSSLTGGLAATPTRSGCCGPPRSLQRPSRSSGACSSPAASPTTRRACPSRLADARRRRAFRADAVGDRQRRLPSPSAAPTPSVDPNGRRVVDPGFGAGRRRRHPRRRAAGSLPADGRRVVGSARAAPPRRRASARHRGVRRRRRLRLVPRRCRSNRSYPAGWVAAGSREGESLDRRGRDARARSSARRRSS